MTTYGFTMIYEHKLIVKKQKTFNDNIFKVQIMQISKSRNKLFIEFIEKSIDLKIQFNIDNLLKINFDFDKKIEMYN